MTSSLAVSPRAEGFALLQAMRACERHVDDHLAAAHRRFGSAALGVIDLPALSEGEIVPAQVKIAGVLFFLRELERTGLVPLVEGLAEALATGTLLLPVGGAVHRLARIARTRAERLSAGERQRIFAQVFGEAGAGDAFERAWSALVSSLVALGREERGRGLGHHRARIGVEARQLGVMLSNGAVGVAGFGAREMVAQVQEAFELLSDPELSAVLGGGGPWTLLARLARRFLGRDGDGQGAVARGRAGLRVIEWIAGAASDLQGAASALDRGHSIVGAAETLVALGAVRP